jgi:hypothetical protein
MPTSHRLDVLLVPADPLRRPDGARRLLEDLVASGTIDDRGGPAASARTWCAGGFARVILDLPETAPDGLAFHANHQGGFRVRCPADGSSIVPAFSAAFSRWRAGGERALPCPACGGSHRLEELDYAPAAAFGPWAVVTADAGEASLTPDALAAAERRIGRFAVVLRRI